MLYGSDYVTHNIHNLYHLINDASKYGTLEEFSAFILESFIACIKMMIRKGDWPLQQLMRRCMEVENLNDTNFIDNSEDQPQTVHEHFDGPLTNNHRNVRQYIFLKLKISQLIVVNTIKM